MNPNNSSNINGAPAYIADKITQRIGCFPGTQFTGFWTVLILSGE